MKKILLALLFPGLNAFADDSLIFKGNLDSRIPVILRITSDAKQVVGRYFYEKKAKGDRTPELHLCGGQVKSAIDFEQEQDVVLLEKTKCSDKNVSGRWVGKMGREDHTLLIQRGMAGQLGKKETPV
jgi:hypothetical protein